MALKAAEDLVRTMVHRSTTLAVCESLTGGGVGAAVTAVAGASAMFRGGLITYASDLKTTLAGVDKGLIEADGVVNELTAIQMALGAQRRCDSDWAVSTTGVAGPSEMDGEAAGTVWFAVVGPQMGMSPRPQYSELKHFDGDRDAVREAVVQHALEMLLRVL